MKNWIFLTLFAMLSAFLPSCTPQPEESTDKPLANLDYQAPPPVYHATVSHQNFSQIPRPEEDVPIGYNQEAEQTESTTFISALVKQPTKHIKGIPIMTSQVGGSDTIYIEDFPGGGNIVDILSWLWRNWQNFAGVILLFVAAYEPIARLTPTDRDNNILRVIQSWLDKILPNRKSDKSGGGTFAAFREKKDAPPIAHVKKE